MPLHSIAWFKHDQNIQLSLNTLNLMVLSAILKITTFEIMTSILKDKVKWSRYRPSVAQRVGRHIALLFHDRSTRRGWVVSSTPWPYFTPRNDPVPILQEAGWVPGPVWMGGKSRPHRDVIPDRPAHTQSLHQLNYPVHLTFILTDL